MSISTHYLQRRGARAPAPPICLCSEHPLFTPLNILHFKESKTEIMIFGPNCTNKVSNTDLGPLLPHVKSTVKNLGVILDMDFKLDKQINSVKSSFYQLRLLSKVKTFLSFNNFERLIHVFISSRLDYCNALYVGVNQASLSRLQLVQNAAARLLTRTRKQEHVWLPYIGFRSVLELILRF